MARLYKKTGWPDQSFKRFQFTGLLKLLVKTRQEEKNGYAKIVAASFRPVYKFLVENGPAVARRAIFFIDNPEPNKYNQYLKEDRFIRFPFESIALFFPPYSNNMPAACCGECGRVSIVL